MMKKDLQEYQKKKKKKKKDKKERTKHSLLFVLGRKYYDL